MILLYHMSGVVGDGIMILFLIAPGRLSNVQKDNDCAVMLASLRYQL